MDHKERGKFFVVEGMDGTGKGTQIKLLQDNLKFDGEFMYFTNITTSPLGRAIREITRDHSYDDFMHDNVGVACMYLSELYLVSKKIETALANGINVVCDRWYYSTMAYVGHSMDDGIVIETIVKDMLKPDVVFYLDLDIDTIMNRLFTRNEKLEFFEKKEKLINIKDNYDSMFNIGGPFDHVQHVNLNAALDPQSIHNQIKLNILSCLEN